MSDKKYRVEELRSVSAKLNVARVWLGESKANALSAESQIRDLEGQQTALKERGGVLGTVIEALRNARDNAPDEWNDLMNSCAGPALCTAWDEVKAVLGESKH